MNERLEALITSPKPTLGFFVRNATLVLLAGWAFSTVLTPQWSYFGTLGWPAIPLGLGSGIVLFLGISGLTQLPGVQTAEYAQLKRLMYRFFYDIGWRGIFVLSLLAGIGEELLFRVFLQTIVAEWLTPTVGILLVSIVFGAMHFLTATYMLVTMLIGVLLGVLYHLTGSAVLIMAMHFSYDVAAFTLLVKFPHFLGIDAATRAELEDKPASARFDA